METIDLYIVRMSLSMETFLILVLGVLTNILVPMKNSMQGGVPVALVEPGVLRHVLIRHPIIGSSWMSEIIATMGDSL